MVELLVSMAILSFGLLVMLSLKKDILGRQSRQISTMEKIEHESNALSFLRRTNPYAEPDGARDIGGGTVLRWRSRGIGREKAVLQWLGRETTSVTRLFLVEYRIVRGQTVIAEGNVELAGWKNGVR